MLPSLVVILILIFVVWLPVPSKPSKIKKWILEQEEKRDDER
jgi:hypothetical protein